jgi:hypothetical protein
MMVFLKVCTQRMLCPGRGSEWDWPELPCQHSPLSCHQRLGVAFIGCVITYIK